MRQARTSVRRRRRPYMILEPVEFLQLGHSAQPAVQAVEVKQQARLVRLMIPPILVWWYYSHTLVRTRLVPGILCLGKESKW